MSPTPGLGLAVAAFLGVVALGAVSGGLAALATVPVLRRERARTDGELPSTRRYVATGVVFGGGAAAMAVSLAVAAVVVVDPPAAVSMAVWTLGSLVVLVGGAAVAVALYRGRRGETATSTGSVLRLNGSYAFVYVGLVVVLGTLALVAL